jgi:hypothetical protein
MLKDYINGNVKPRKQRNLAADESDARSSLTTRNLSSRMLLNKDSLSSSFTSAAGSGLDSVTNIVAIKSRLRPATAKVKKNENLILPMPQVRYGGIDD